MTGRETTNTPNVSMELLLEAIDRNKQQSWDRYSTMFCFTLSGDGTVQVTAQNESERTYTVKIHKGEPSNCSCYIHHKGIERADCRHMRAVDAHPQL